MPVGFRVFSSISRPEPALVQRFIGLHTADISDVMNMAGSMDTAIHPIYQPMKQIVGTAVTISVPTGAYNMVKAGIAVARAGDVLIINAYGNLNTALVGGNVCRALLARGLAGLIADGAVRDVSEIQEDGFPVYARGTTTIAGVPEDRGEVNVPIACGQVVVNPGDIIVADNDGIVVIPPAAAEEILDGVARIEAKYAALQPALRQGKLGGEADIERKLREQGCEFVER